MTEVKVQESLLDFDLDVFSFMLIYSVCISVIKNDLK